MDSAGFSSVHGALLRALLEALPEGALVLTPDAHVLAHNERAHALLQWVRPAKAHGGAVEELEGVAATTLLDAHVLHEALSEVPASAGDEAEPARASLAVTGREGRVLRVQARRTGDAQAPWLLLMERSGDTDGPRRGREHFLHTLTEGMRGPLANVRAAIETITTYPTMESAVEEQFKQIILEQSVTLSGHLDRTLDEYARQLKSQRKRDVMVASDLLVLLRTALQQELGFVVHTTVPEQPVRLRIDPYTLVQALVHLAGLIENAARFTELTCALRASDAAALLTLEWTEGEAITEDRLERWLTQPLPLEVSVVTTTVQEVLDWHQAAVSILPLEGRSTALQVQLPCL